MTILRQLVGVDRAATSNAIFRAVALRAAVVVFSVGIGFLAAFAA